MPAILAVIGAVTGVLGLFLNLRKEWLDRARLTIQVDPKSAGDGTGSLTAIIENHGRQPVSIGPFGLTWDVEGDPPHRSAGELLFNSLPTDPPLRLAGIWSESGTSPCVPTSTSIHRYEAS